MSVLLGASPRLASTAGTAVLRACVVVRLSAGFFRSAPCLLVCFRSARAGAVRVTVGVT